MKNILQKGMLFILLLLSCMVLSACEKGEGALKQEGASYGSLSEYVYVPEFTSLVSNNNVYYYQPTLQKDKLFYLNYTYEIMGMALDGVRLSIQDIDDPNEKKDFSLDFNLEGYRGNISDFFVDSDRNIYNLWCMYPCDEKGNYINDDYSFFLEKCDGEMNQLVVANISEYFVDKNNSFVVDMAFDTEGKVYIASGTVIYVLNSDLSFDKVIATSNEGIEHLVESADGGIWFTKYGNEGWELIEINTETGEIGEAYTNLPDVTLLDFIMPDEGKLIVYNEEKLYEYDMSDMECVKEINWLDCYIDGNDIQNISVSEEKIIVYTYDAGYNLREMAFLNKTPKDEVPLKEVITVATLESSNPSLQEAVVKFNKYNDTYKVVIKAYVNNTTNISDITGTVWTDGRALMKAEIASDDSPDIIDLSDVDIMDLVLKDALEDLTPYLEKSTAANLYDFVPSVLESFKINSKQVAVPMYFEILTWMAKYSTVGNKSGWSFEDVIMLADAESDATLMHYYDKYSALQMLLEYNWLSFIDPESGNCSFDSQEFIDLLKLADRFEPYEGEESEAGAIVMDKVLLSPAVLRSVSDYQIYGAMMDNNAVCIGYPTADGSAGIYLRGNTMYGISAKSDQKEGAWAFIESQLADNTAAFYEGFPSRKEALQELFEKSMTSHDWETAAYAASKEEIDAISSIINLAKPSIPINQTIFTIIEEEAAFFLEGQKSAKEAAEVIQNRVELYVQENR